ncbi:hypothetical protein GC722_13295 [Auraticoccus sp. F435]|uniref:DUF4190 domain-containing protein n=1 Tax=Auraticoccus cholistanensis TaxID=2656650 RepID=A0A6A9UW95_9ACTN|nr:DUF4190 domain-containing protein [Auraticoccus cholistanensis]MVA76991.1 hypothetical protein [Auraticoccus cholistanensis]
MSQPPTSGPYSGDQQGYGSGGPGYGAGSSGSAADPQGQSWGQQPSYGQQPSGSDPYSQSWGSQPSQTASDPYSQGWSAQSSQSASDPYGYSQQSASDPYAPQQGYGMQSYPAQPYGYAPVLPDHPQSVTVLVLGILSLVLAGVTGPFAWYMGSKARKELRQNPGQYKDGGMLTVGWVLGIVGTAYLALMVAFFVVYVIIIVAILGMGVASY